MNQQHVTLLVLLDLSAAFHTIHHDKLIQRIKSDCGVTDNVLSWLRSYLSDWFQPVSVNGGHSKKIPLCQGVPQGSFLGPLLFIIYLHKLFDIVERHLPQVHCYADDTQLYVSFSPNQSAEADTALKSMTDCISDVRSLMISDNLMLNDDKTEFLILRTKQQLAKVNIDNVKGHLDLPAEPRFASLPRVTVWLHSREVHSGPDFLPLSAAGEVSRAAAAIFPRLRGPHQSF